MSSTRRGCLVIADIGGYTRYLTGVELEHSTDVLADLLQTVVDALEPSFRIAKLEGDAIFAHEDGGLDGAVVVDALTGAYMAFMRRRLASSTDIRRALQFQGQYCDAHRARFRGTAMRAREAASSIILVHLMTPTAASRGPG